MATVFQGEPGEVDGEWFCGNSFVYATCGRDAFLPAFQEESLRSASARKQVLAKIESAAKLHKGSGLELASTSPPLLRPRKHIVDAEAPMLTSRESPPPELSSVPEQEPAAMSDVPIVEFCVDIVEKDGERWVCMKIVLPGVEGLAAVDLRISDECIALTSDNGHTLQEPWPEPVDADRAVASFAAKRQRLVVKAPTLTRAAT